MPLPTGRRLLLAAVCAVAVSTVYAAQPMLTEIGVSLGISRAELGWVITSGQLGYLVGLVFLVPLGDMISARTLVVGHLALTALGVAVAAVATRPWMLFAGLALAGLFAVVVQTTVAYTAVMSEPHERGRNLGFVTAGVVVGILGSRVVAGLLTTACGWRAVYIILVVLLLALALLSLKRLPSGGRHDLRHYRHALTASRRLLGQRLFLSRGLIALCVFASFSTLWSGLSLPLQTQPWHLSPTQTGLFGIAGLAGALGAGRAGRRADRGFASGTTGIALAVLAVSWCAIAQAGWSLWLLGAGVVMLDFAVQAVHVSNQHLLTMAHPDHTSLVVGSYMVFYSAGSALGAATTTALYAAAGWAGSCLLGTAFAIIAFTLWALDRRADAHREQRNSCCH